DRLRGVRDRSVVRSCHRRAYRCAGPFRVHVIGDPVNEAARVPGLAKLEDGHVLASAVAVSGALDAEALCWDVAEVVALRGRTAPTQLARPLNLAAPEEVSSEASG